MPLLFLGSTDDVSAEEIKDLRKRKNLTQEELASLLGVGVATIRRWECGAAKPTGNNHAALLQLMATADGQNLRQCAKRSPTQCKHFAKKILAAQIRGVSGMPLEQIVRPETWKSLVKLLGPLRGLSTCQMEPALPFPQTSTEEAVASQEDLQGTVDSVLLDMFNREREARGLTTSKMLETILWKYFKYPALSFQPQARGATMDGSVCAIEPASINNNREA